MKKIYCAFLFGVLCMLFLQPVSNFPGTRLQSRPVGLNCYNCYVCMRPYRGANGVWWPTFYYWEDVWIAGNDKKGTLYFYERPSPDEDELGPPLYIYESTGEPDPPEKAMFLPAGTYLVLIKGECFHAYKHTCRDDMYFYIDDGTGAQKMSAELTTDKPKYGREDGTAVLRLQITDVDTGEYIEVDTVFGSIKLPDGTQKTLEKETWEEDWVWNDTEKWYEYTWDFTNDSEEYSDPKEGFYEAQLYVKKQYYQDVKVKTEFSVCYHIEIDLEFDKDIPEYSVGEPVYMTIHATNEEGEPECAEVISTLMLPDGSEKTDLAWNLTDPGIYVTMYVPTQEGEYNITVEMDEGVICYLEEAERTFFVRECEKSHVYLEIDGDTIDEPVEFVVTAFDDDGNRLSGGEIKSILYLPDGSTTKLSWKDKQDGIYTAEYSPPLLGSYSLSGFIIVTGDNGCYTGFFSGIFTARRKRLPDLVIFKEDITVYPEPKLGKTVTISIIVRNIGDAVAENFRVIILVEGKVIHEERVRVLFPLESITIQCIWKFEKSGAYIISAVVDPPEGMI